MSFGQKVCPACRSQLGYLPDEGRITALDAGPEAEAWIASGRDEGLKFCSNRGSPAACNWMLDAGNPSGFCIACRLNRTIPDLGDPDNARYWGSIEAAKRRLVLGCRSTHRPTWKNVALMPRSSKKSTICEVGVTRGG